MYALRVDISDNARRDSVVSWLAAHGSYVLVQEGGTDNPHVHALLESTMAVRMLRQDLRRKLPFLVGNGDYSLTLARDAEKYERYICKGESESELPVVVSRMGVAYTEAWVKERHSEYWQLQKDYKARHKRKGLHSSTIVEKVEEICKNKNIRWDKEFDIGAEYLRLVSEGKKGVNIHQLRSTVKGVQLQLCPDDAAIQRLLEEAFPGQAFGAGCSFVPS